MTETAPLFFERRLNMLSPVNPAAKEAVQAIEGRVTVKITKTARNQRRRALYWIVTALVAELLNDAHDLALTDNDLHDLIRTKLRMYDEITLPSGDIYRKLWSTSDRAMNEAARAAFTTKAFEIYSRWTGIDTDTLTKEGIEIA